MQELKSCQADRRIHASRLHSYWVRRSACLYCSGFVPSSIMVLIGIVTGGALVSSTFHIAQINIGRIIAPLDDPGMSGFVSRLDEINLLVRHFKHHLDRNWHNLEQQTGKRFIADDDHPIRYDQ